MYARITRRFREAIQSSQLPDNCRLPTNRELANLLNVDRSTVSRAYLELSKLGLIESHVGRGTFVRPQKDRETSQIEKTWAAEPESKLSWTEKFSLSSLSTVELLSRQPVTANTAAGDIISFAGGIPTEEFYPNDQFQRIVRELSNSEQSNQMFGYSPAEGHPSLKEEVLKHLALSGIETNDDELLIVSGSQQAIDLVTNVFVDPTDFVLLEDPSYFWAICNFRSRQARCIPIAVDEEGLRLDQLEGFLQRQKAKLLYVMPSFQNPTGATMSVRRRIELLDLARRYQLPILEDNFVGDLTYDQESMPPLRSLPGGRETVIHQGTFSKALCPGLRLGWLVAPPEVTHRLLLAKRSSDLSTNSMAQVILATYLKEGLYSEHLVHVRDAYARRRDVMIEAMEKQLSTMRFDGQRILSWQKPKGGLFLWVKLPDGLSARELLSFAERQGVTFSPGDMFFLNGDHNEYFRLCFIQTDEATIKTGIERLARAVNSYLTSVTSSRAGASTTLDRTRARDNVLI